MHSRKSEIIFLSLDREYPEQKAGAEIFRFRLTQALSGRGDRVRLLSMGASPEIREAIGSFQASLVCRFPRFAKRFFLKFPFLIGFSFFSVATSKSKVVLSWAAYSLIIGYPLCRLFGKRCVVRCAGADIYSLDKVGPSLKEKRLKLISSFSFKLLLRSDAVIANSNFMKRHLVEHGAPASLVIKIPNSVEVPKFAITQDPRTDNMQLISVGRLSKDSYRDKQQDTLIRSFAKFHSAYPSSLLFLVGEGAAKGDLQRLVSELDLNSAVRFTGNLPSEKVLALVSQSDIFVFPSAIEGMSNALLEAVLLGVPVVASDIEPNKELLDQVEGSIVFKAGSVELLSEALLTIATDIANRKKLAVISSSKLAETYSLSNAAAAYEKVLFGY